MNTFNIIWNYNAQVVNQNNYYNENETLHYENESHNDSRELPRELQSNRARSLLSRAVDQDLLKDDYQPSDSIKKWQLALLADAIARELALKSKWKVFGRLWGIPSESLRSEATRYKNPEEEKKFQKILQRLIG